LITSDDILKALEYRYSEKSGWIFFREFRFGTGYAQSAMQRLDAWAIQAWDQKVIVDGARVTVPNLRRAFEIKCCRSDAVSELRNPDKRWNAYAVSHEFWFVAPPDIIKKEELSSDDGLMIFDGTELKIVKRARLRVTQPPKWNFVAGLCRRISEQERHILEIKKANGV
jgi:hypothetical protein